MPQIARTFVNHRCGIETNSRPMRKVMTSTRLHHGVEEQAKCHLLPHQLPYIQLQNNWRD